MLPLPALRTFVQFSMVEVETNVGCSYGRQKYPRPDPKGEEGLARGTPGGGRPRLPCLEHSEDAFMHVAAHSSCRAHPASWATWRCAAMLARDGSAASGRDG